MKLKTLTLTLLAISSFASDSQPSGRDLLEKSLLIPVPETLGAVYEVLHSDHRGREKERKALMFFTKDEQDEKLRKQVIYFLAPRDLKGTSMLTENHMSWGEEYSSKSWVYSPLFRRTKLNSISNWRNRQFGSSMNVFDGLHHDLEWFKATNKGLETVNDRKAWKVEVEIVDERVRERSGYNRITRWIDQESLQTIKMEIFNVKDELVKTSDAQLIQVDGYWLVSTMRVSLKRADGREEITTVNIKDYQLELDSINQGLFNQRGLESGIPLSLQNQILGENSK